MFILTKAQRRIALNHKKLFQQQSANNCNEMILLVFYSQRCFRCSEGLAQTIKSPRPEGVYAHPRNWRFEEALSHLSIALDLSTILIDAMKIRRNPSYSLLKTINYIAKESIKLLPNDSRLRKFFGLLESTFKSTSKR